MTKYYTSNWLQSRSIGVFVSAGLHLILLGIILPKMSGKDFLLDGKLTLRNIDLITLTSEQQQRLPESLQPPDPLVTLPEEGETFSDYTPPVFTNNLPPVPIPDLETIPLPPPPDTLPPESLPSVIEPRITLIPVTLPPIPRELIEIINPRDDLFNSPKVTEPQIIPEPEIAIQPQVTPVERENDLIASVQAKAVSLKYNPSNTSPTDVAENYQRWIRWQTEDNPQKIDLPGKYPLDGCIKKIQGDTQYGVLVNPEGKIINLHLIQSAGYSLLNEQAAQQVEAYNFSEAISPKEPYANGIQPYLITVKFTYNADLCPSLSLSPP
jgi:outer membrane biosynthesis protein TonB